MGLNPHTILSNKLHVGPAKGKEKEAILKAANICYKVLNSDRKILNHA